MLNEAEIKDYFNLVNSHAKKELGQNFLIDEEAIETIASSLELKENDNLLEIGPGLGAITGEVVNKTEKYIAVEYDEKFVTFLNKAYEKTNLQVVKNNILKYKDFEANKVIGNLPYYISTDILEMVLRKFHNLETATFMVQKEFFERITTNDKRVKGPLNYFIEYMYNVEKIMLVKKNCFFPAPTIDSVVFKVTRKIDKNWTFAGYLFDILNVSFKNRRKTLGNNLKNYFNSSEDFESAFELSNITKTTRAEDLKLEEFISLTEAILKVKKINL